MRLFYQELQTFNNYLERTNQKILEPSDLYPCLEDKTVGTGFDAHYVYHTAWAARYLAQTKPTKHTDISSLLHFSAIISAFIDVEFYDYRPANVKLSNLKSSSADLTNLPFNTESIISLSCMHVIEHIGLGRYGDPISVDGDQKAASELSRVLSKNGKLLIAVPVGRPRIQFNAHRVYSHQQVLSLFKTLELEEHALIPDSYIDHGIISNPSIEIVNSQIYGCGCYIFRK